MINKQDHGPFTLDTSDFDIKFQKLVKDTIPGLGLQGAKRAAAALLADAIQDEPRVPHLHGHLWRSQLIGEPRIEGKGVAITAGFNTPYAARLHEAPDGWNWTLEGSGPKYLETSLIQNSEKYMKIQAETIRGGAR